MSGKPASRQSRRGAARPCQKMPLTPRQKQICALFGEGLTNKEIADRLDSSPLTVAGHIKQIFVRLRAKNRAEATARYLKFA
jgi:DNA-binding CsgD family transcriptional regulator